MGQFVIGDVVQAAIVGRILGWSRIRARRISYVLGNHARPALEPSGFFAAFFFAFFFFAGFAFAGFAFAGFAIGALLADTRAAISCARSLAIRTINFIGTGCASGKRIVPFSTS